MNDQREPLAEWEYALQGLPVPPEVTAATDARQAERAAAEPPQFAVLHEARGSVDLTHVWEPIRISQAHYEYRGWQLIERLVDTVCRGRGWIVARRLQQALDAMANSSDDQVHMEMPTLPEPGGIQITAWCWESTPPWRVEATLDVHVQGGRTRITSSAPVVLTTQDWDEGAITYTDSSGTLTHIVAGWLTGWMGRLGLQGAAGLVADEPGELPPAPTAAEFAADL